jgi:type IV pilus assembly protein PilQ
MKRSRTLLTFLAVLGLALGSALAQPRTELPADERFDVPVAFSTGMVGESLPAMIDALARSVGLTPIVDAVPDVSIVYDIGEPKPFRQVWSLILTLNELDYVLQPNDVVVVGTPERLRRLATGAETREPTMQRFYRVSNDPTQVAAILERVVPDAAIDTLPGNNAVIVVGTEAEHRSVEAALAEFDQPRDAIALEQRTFFLSHADPLALADTISSTVIVLDATGQRVDDYRVAPDARTNSLVVTGTAAVLERIGRLINDLDTPDRAEPEPEPEPEAAVVRRLYRSVGDVARIAAIVERAVPATTLDVLPGTNAFFVRATEAQHAEVEATLAEFDTAPEPAPEPIAEPEPAEPTVRRLYRSNGEVQRIATIVERVVPAASVEVLPGTNAFFVAATETEHDAVEAALAEFDAPPPAPEPIAEPEDGAEPSVERIYRVTTEPNRIATILRRVVPAARVDVLAGTDAVVVVATEANHDAVAQTIQEFDVTGPVVQLEQRTYALSNARAAELANVLQDSSQVGQLEEDGRAGELRVVAEPRTNSLIVTGTAAAQRRLSGLISELDRPQRQVNIQVRIQEITRSAALSLGIDWGGGFGSLSTQILGGGLRFIFDTTQVISGLNVLAVLDTLETQGLTRRVDDSNITVVDAGIGRIQSGGTIFISLPGAQQNIERTIPYGVQIDVTPRIAADGRITLDVDASVEDILSTTDDPTFLNLSTRNVTTSVSVEEGQTVLLGGLLQNSLTLSRRQIPVLGSLPIIGDLFSRNVSEEDSVDLLIILTAQIID